jgi:hypothetical protein
VAFNSGHTPKVVELPHWHGRTWRVVIDTGKLAPYDILIPDAELAPEEAEQVGVIDRWDYCATAELS